MSDMKDEHPYEDYKKFETFKKIPSYFNELVSTIEFWKLEILSNHTESLVILFPRTTNVSTPLILPIVCALPAKWETKSSKLTLTIFLLNR